MPKGNPSGYMKPPKKGGKPKRITTVNAPGGPQTPGAKKKRKGKLQERLESRRMKVKSEITGN